MPPRFHPFTPPWWRSTSTWSALLATLAVLALLLVFYQVVRESVQHSELRNKLAARQAEVLWRCNASRDPQVNENCLLQHHATALGDAVLQGQLVPAQFSRIFGANMD